MKETVHTDKAPQAIGPYAQAVKVGAETMLFCSGQIPIDPATGGIIEGSAAQQTWQVMKNINAVLEAAGFTLNDVVKTTIYLTDLAFFSEVNSVYESFFDQTYPARTTVQVSALPRGALVEVEAFACR